MRTGDKPPATSREGGYAMVALMVSLNVMAVMLTVAMPVWRQMVQREREIELVFRGEQYRRAIQLYERRNGPGALPADLDVLVEGRFLRKPFVDPVTGDDFVLIRQGQQAGGGTAPVSGAALGGIAGVVSSSRARSIRIYQGQTSYDQWLFVHTGGEAGQTPGGRGGSGQAVGRGDGRGGRGGPPVTGRGGRAADGRGGDGRAGRGRGPGGSP
jgi:type II secretory pathway pseudopilin PulG